MSLQINHKKVLGVSGTLTFDSVPGIYLKSQTLLGEKVKSVDLAAVTLVDSAGLALLLEWQAEAQKRGSTLAFINAPADLLRLAALSESTSLLGLTARPEG